MSSKTYNIGIVGATGAVGQELIHLLYERNFPLGELRLFASARSKGKTITYKNDSWTVECSDDQDFGGIDIFFFSAGGSISKNLAQSAVDAGGVVIDNSSAYRMHAGVPLVVPGINDYAAMQHNGIIANPNCSSAVALMGLYPLHQAFGLKRFFASTYQAVSGAGAAGIIELEEQLKAWAAGDASSKSEVFPHPMAFNLLPHVDAFQDNGYTKEEMKMLNECRKIMDLPDMLVSCTCVRVPVLRAHSIAINAEFEKPVNVAEAQAAVEAFEGAELCDNPADLRYPMPLDFSGKEKCGVGRIRIDTAFENGLSFWVVGDQLWRGAALNAVEIAEVLVRD